VAVPEAAYGPRHVDRVDDPDAFECSADKTSRWTEDAAFALGTDGHVPAPELDRVMNGMPGQVRCLFELTVR
jgi:hypothetical protein